MSKHRSGHRLTFVASSEGQRTGQRSAERKITNNHTNDISDLNTRATLLKVLSLHCGQWQRHLGSTAKRPAVTSRCTRMNSRGSPFAQGGRMTSPSLVPFCLQPVWPDTWKRKGKREIKSPFTWKGRRNSGLDPLPELSHFKTREALRDHPSVHSSPYQEGPPEHHPQSLVFPKTAPESTPGRGPPLAKLRGPHAQATSGKAELPHPSPLSLFLDTSHLGDHWWFPLNICVGFPRMLEAWRVNSNELVLNFLLLTLWQNSAIHTAEEPAPRPRSVWMLSWLKRKYKCLSLLEIPAIHVVSHRPDSEILERILQNSHVFAARILVYKK